MNVSNARPPRVSSSPPSPLDMTLGPRDMTPTFPLGLAPLSARAPGLRACLTPPTTFDHAMQRCGRAGPLPLPGGFEARVYTRQVTPSDEWDALQRRAAQISKGSLLLSLRVPTHKLYTLGSVYDDVADDLAHDTSDFAAIALYQEDLLAAIALVKKPAEGSCLRVNYLASNPLSVAKLPGRPRVAGRTMLALCEDLSVAAGYGGSISLYALDSALPWYRQFGFEQADASNYHEIALPPRRTRLDNGLT